MQQQPVGRPKVFISYSRRDLRFADWLVTALETRGIEVLIDRRDLPALEDWERELLGFIRKVDTVVFIVSSHSVASPACDWEIEQVRKHNKRLAPIVISEVSDAKVPSDIATINYLFFTDPTRFEQQADELARALNTDLAWIRDHTRIGELARRWIEHGKPDDSLLRGNELREANEWAARRPREAPPVSAEQRSFLAASGQGESARIRHEGVQRKRIRRALVGAGSLGLLALVVGAVAYNYYAEATGQCTASNLYTYATGRFEKSEGKWKEYKETQLFATFREMRRDAKYIYIADNRRVQPMEGAGRSPLDVREFIVRIPKCGGLVEWSWANPLEWTAFQIVERSAPDSRLQALTQFLQQIASPFRFDQTR